MNNLKSLYSKFIMNICESKYSDADTVLEQILTEKVKKKVERVVKKKMECDKGCKGCKSCKVCKK
jgi:hypothetical protein